MKKLILFLLTLTVILGVFASCDNGEVADTETSAALTSDEVTSEGTSAETSATTSETETTPDHVVRATIIEISGNAVLIEPVEGEWELRSADRIWISINGFDDIGAKVGSVVDVTYDGLIMETYPAQINASKWSKVSDPTTPER